MSKPKLCVSFSGGKTSGFMAWWIKQNMAETHDLRFVFANTGLEHEKTLEFVERCDKEWSLGVEWVEAVPNHNERKGSGARVVDFDSASRNGEPFEAVIQKYGISNQSYPHCTRELKANAIRSHLVESGWSGYQIAIGIRADEIDRMQVDARERRIIYPLISQMPMDRAAVDRWWDRQEWNLEIPPYLGNCVTCWKKSDRKLLTIAQDDPHAFDFMRRMEERYPLAGHNVDGTPRTFFRNHRTAAEIIARSRQPFTRWFEPAKSGELFDDEDMPNGCSDSCEVVWEGEDAA